jgi:hypothetical protein
MALRVNIAGYNTIVFSAHLEISEHMEWEKEFSKRFPSCIGRVDVSYLSPRNKIRIGEQCVPLSIEGKLRRLRERKLREKKAFNR